MISAPPFVLGIAARLINLVRESQGSVSGQHLLWKPDRWWWVLSLLFGFAIAQFLAWKEQYQKRKENEAKAAFLCRHFESEKGPKITLAYKNTAIHKGFYIYSDKDILGATVISPAGVKVQLPHVITAEDRVPLEFYSVHKDETEEGFERAFLEFCGDRQEVKIPLEFHYWDHCGNEYNVRWFVVWSKLAIAWGQEPRVEQEHGSYRMLVPQAANRADISTIETISGMDHTC